MASKLLSDGRRVLVGSKADPDSKKYRKISGGRSVVLKDGTQLSAEESRMYGKGTKDNQITNAMVDSGLLPESQRETYSQGTTPTVLTNTNIVEEVIPRLDAKANELTQTGEQFDAPQEEEEVDLSITKPKEPEDPYLKQQMKLLDSYKKSLDRNARNEISSIQERMASLSADQAAINEANTAGVRGALMRGGTGGAFRYAPQGAFGGVAGEASAGVRALADIASQESELISQVKSAQANNDYQLLEQKLGLLDTVRQERAAATTAASEALKTAEHQSFVENAVIGEINKGNVDATSIFQALGGQVSFDEIQKITNTMPKRDPFTLSSTDIRYDADGNIVAQGSKVGGGTGTVLVGDALSVGEPVVTVGNPTIPGLGTSYGSSTIEAQLVIDDIVHGLPTQLLNSEAEIPRWRESVRKQLAAGYEPQNIIDKLSGFRVFDETKKPLADVFYNLAIGTDLPPQTISDLVNRGATEQAMTTVENKQLESANAFFAGTDTARSTIKQADTVLSLLNDPDFPIEKLGQFDGREFKVGVFAGMTDEDTLKVQQLESALALLNAPIRLEVAGTAATPEEMAKIAAFQSDILSQPEIIKTQVESLRDAVLAFHNQARSQRGLPTVDKDQVLDNKKRLELYKGLADQNSKIQYGELDNSALLDSILDVPYQPTGSSSNVDFWSNLQSQ